jgi:amino acid permease
MWTAMLIGDLMECTEELVRQEQMDESAHDWPFLGWVAAGEAGRTVVTVCQLGELWGVMLTFLVVNGVNLNLIFPAVSKEMGIIIGGVLSFLLLFPSAKMLSYFSSVGIFATILAVGSLFWSSESMDVWASEEESMTLLDITQVPMALGIIQFCFVAHGALPTMYREMKRPHKDYKPAMRRAFSFAGLFYLTVGFFAYCVYGMEARPNFMENLGRTLDLKLIPGKAFLYLLATAFFAMNIQCSFPLFAMGLIAASELKLGISENSFAMRAVWKFAFLTFTTFFAVALKDCMAPVLSLVGCVCATNTCLLFPMLFTLKLAKTSVAQKIVMGIALVYSAYTLIVGTYRDVLNIAALLSK